jgi:5-methylcytosine-specific restriction endonuclease McrA
MNTVTSLNNLTDRDLIAEVKRLAQVERESTAALIASLAEMDARRLYLGEGCSSLFVYCTQVLHLSEHAAYGRIEAARAIRRFPIILERLERGELTLTAVSLLRPHLTDANCGELLEAASHKSKREVERLVAEIAPHPDAPAIVRKLPARVPSTAERSTQGAVAEVTATASTVRDPVRPASVDDSSPAPAAASEFALDATASRAAPAAASVPSRRACPLVTPVAPERYKVQFTIDQKTHDKLRRAQDLLRHVVPNGDPAEILDRALTLLIEQLEKAKIASATRAGRQRPLAPESRRVPAAVRRIVWARDEGRCAFVGGEGRCRETAFLEFHHVTPYARGGKATADQIQLRCRAHNQYEAVEAFGPRALMVREHAVPYGAARSLGPDRAEFVGGRWATGPLSVGTVAMKRYDRA